MSISMFFGFLDLDKTALSWPRKKTDWSHYHLFELKDGGKGGK